MRLALFAALLAPGLAAAQADPLGWSGRATLSAAYASGNAPSERLYGDGRLTHRTERQRFNLDGKAERRAEANAPKSTSWVAAASYDRFLSERRFAYARGSLEHDTAKDIERRSALGVGLGAELFADGPFTLSVRGGPEYVTVERRLAPGESYPALGWGVKAVYRPAAKRLEIFHEQDGFWNLEDRGHLFVRTKSGLRMPLVERLSATIQVNLDWEREPAPGRRPTDAMLLVGLDYTL